MNKKAFTLTEIIAVIVIIGLIILVAIPVSQNLMENNKKDKYKLYVETIEKAIYTYADLYMKTDSSIDLNSNVSDSVISTTLNLDKFEGATVTYSTNYTIQKSNNGKITITPEDFRLVFDGVNCSKKECS